MRNFTSFAAAMMCGMMLAAAASAGALVAPSWEFWRLPRHSGRPLGRLPVLLKWIVLLTLVLLGGNVLVLWNSGR